ncbi:MAG: exopolyphosphatase [Actinomycetota bacterium]|nr:exopolyphosphatase [Actinomycetota bacterium]
MPSRHRLVTRSDFDGLICAVLLREIGLIDDILFVHPKDVQDGKVAVTRDDILTNLPYVPEAHLVFDHHSSEALRNADRRPNHVLSPTAPSAARVVFDHYGGAQRFPGVREELMAAVDQADSAQYSLDDILKPRGWALLNFLMDSRTGLGRFRHFRISNYDLMMQLIDQVPGKTAEQVLALPDVAERVDLYAEQEPLFLAQLQRCTRRLGELVALDLRDEEVVHAGNRFAVYAQNPDATVSVHVLWGKQKQNTVLAVGKSILNRASTVDIGALMLSYGGGGHVNAGTCQVEHADADRVLHEIAAHVNASALAR